MNGSTVTTIDLRKTTDVQGPYIRVMWSQKYEYQKGSKTLEMFGPKVRD